MKKNYQEPEFLKWKFELTENVADLSFGADLGDGDEWNTEDGEDTID